jgi:hypothetical protein
MKRKNLTSIVLLVLLVSALLVCASCGGNTDPQEGEKNEKSEVTRYGQGYRFDQNGWIYLHIEGEPHERGFQHGYLAAPEIGNILRSLKYLSFWNTGKEWDFFVDSCVEMFVPQLEQEFLDEIKGIADGANAAGVSATWEEILTWNAYYELVYAWWPGQMEEDYAQTDDSGRSHCSGFIATGDATSDGGIVMAHNQWEDYETAQFSNLIIDALPAQGHRMLFQSYAGFIYSHTDFFVSDAGLMGTETALSVNRFDPSGVIDSFRERKAMQYAESLDQFAEIMINGNNGGSADSWLVGDVDTGEVMRLELGLEFTSVSKTSNGYFLGFNAPVDPRIRNLECDSTGYADIRRHQGARRVRLTQLLEENYGKVDTGVAEAIMADHYDVYLNETRPGSRTIDGHYELDAMEYGGGLEGNLPFHPSGSVDGMVTDSSMAGGLSFIARWGNSCGMPFDAGQFLEEHPQWDYLEGYLLDRPSQPWTVFEAGE